MDELDAKALREAVEYLTETTKIEYFIHRNDLNPEDLCELSSRLFDSGVRIWGDRNV